MTLAFKYEDGEWSNMADDNDKDANNERMIRLFLLRLKKVQVSESLDRMAANGTSHISLLVPGTTPRQIALTKSWITNFIVNALEIAVDESEAEDEDAKKGNAATDGEANTEKNETDGEANTQPSGEAAGAKDNNDATTDN